MHTHTAILMMFVLALVSLVTEMFLTVTGESGGDVRWRDSETLSVMMNSAEMRCAHVNLTAQMRVCQVLSEGDQRNMVCGGNG